jgi:hypothetical protein
MKDNFVPLCTLRGYNKPRVTREAKRSAFVAPLRLPLSLVRFRKQSHIPFVQNLHPINKADNSIKCINPRL